MDFPYVRIVTFENYTPNITLGFALQKFSRHAIVSATHLDDFQIWITIKNTLNVPRWPSALSLAIERNDARIRKRLCLAATERRPLGRSDVKFCMHVIKKKEAHARTTTTRGTTGCQFGLEFFLHFFPSLLSTFGVFILFGFSLIWSNMGSCHGQSSREWSWSADMLHVTCDTTHVLLVLHQAQGYHVHL